jgi:hypothetical protein
MPGATVINIKSGESYDEYIGHQMPPFMSPRGSICPDGRRSGRLGFVTGELLAQRSRWWLVEVDTSHLSKPLFEP